MLVLCSSNCFYFISCMYNVHHTYLHIFYQTIRNSWFSNQIKRYPLTFCFDIKTKIQNQEFCTVNNMLRLVLEWTVQCSPTVRFFKNIWYCVRSSFLNQNLMFRRVWSLTLIIIHCLVFFWRSTCSKFDFRLIWLVLTFQFNVWSVWIAIFWCSFQD